MKPTYECCIDCGKQFDIDRPEPRASLTLRPFWYQYRPVHREKVKTNV